MSKKIKKDEKISENKKVKRSKKNKKRLNIEWMIIIVFILCIFMLISLHTEFAGIVGKFIKYTMLGNFSYMGYLLPYFIFAFSISFLFDIKLKRKIIILSILFFSFLSIIQLFFIRDVVYPFSISDSVNIYVNGIKLVSNGLVLNLILWLFYKPIGFLGVVLLEILLLIGLICVIYDITPIKLFSSIYKKIINYLNSVIQNMKKVKENKKSKCDVDNEFVKDNSAEDEKLKLKFNIVEKLKFGNKEIDDNKINEIYGIDIDKFGDEERKKIRDNFNRNYNKILNSYNTQQEVNAFINEIKIKSIDIDKKLNVKNEENETVESISSNKDLYLNEENMVSISEIESDQLDEKNINFSKIENSEEKDENENIEICKSIDDKLELEKNILNKDEEVIENDVELKFEENEKYETEDEIEDESLKNDEFKINYFSTDDVFENSAILLKDSIIKKQSKIKENNYNNSDYVNLDNKKIFNLVENEVNIAKKEEFIKNKENNYNTEKYLEYIKNYKFPLIDFLKIGKNSSTEEDRIEIVQNIEKLEKTFEAFKIDAKVVDVCKGPMVTRFEIKPNEGVKVSKISSLSDDIALNLAATSVRIEAPIPGKQAVGIEIPNKKNTIVTLRDVITSKEYKENKSILKVALGKNIGGEAIVSDLSKMPHLLIAGATGSGKSVCVNTIITSILYNSKPNEVKFLMIDPKVVELNIYNSIPHLALPVVTDPKKANLALNWAVQEMNERYEKFAGFNVRDIDGYNSKIENDIMPRIVIIIDELADLMMTAPAQIEESICRLAQKARACGIHLIVATQRPSVDVITGVIKANIPSRIAFSVSSQIDSRTILDMSGAEKLLGKGDMLYFPVGFMKPVRLQGCFVSDEEVEKIVNSISTDVNYFNICDILSDDNAFDDNLNNDEDELLNEVINFVLQERKASASLLQRKFRIGYNRAARLIDLLEEKGIIGPSKGSKPRDILID